MLSQVLRTIREQGLLAGGERVLVAVSGGPDSTALLHALRHFAARLRLDLLAATVDHGLRPEAAAEAALVAERCLALGVPCQVITVDVKAARRPHVSGQEAARNARLAALQETAERLGCSHVALGHTADDQAETVVFRIIRGTGIAGLAGIPYRRGIFVRPLLDVRRSEIVAFLNKRHLAFIEDSSNANRHYARVRVRLDLLPILARENPRVVEAVLALAREARAHKLGVSDPELPSLPPLPRRVAALVRRLATEARGTRRVSVPRGEVVVSYGNVSFQSREGHPLRQRGSRRSSSPGAGVTIVTGPGIYRPPGCSEGPALRLEESSVGAPAPPGAALFDASAFVPPLQVRAPRPGDRMRPRGGSGSRKLSDLLVDAKVPRDQRIVLPVLTAADGTILFVAGLRPSEIGRPHANTHRCLTVHAIPASPAGNSR